MSIPNGVYEHKTWGSFEQLAVLINRKDSRVAVTFDGNSKKFVLLNSE
jgi:hypothetical protein